MYFYLDDENSLTLAFNAMFILSKLSYYGQLLEQLNVASLSRPSVFLQCSPFTAIHWANKWRWWCSCS